MTEKRKSSKHIVLTSHPSGYGPKPIKITWGAANAAERGPIIGTVTSPQQRNCIGTHSGSYAVYRALAVAYGALDPLHKADLTDTSPTVGVGPFGSWYDKEKIVSLDPFGADVSIYYAELIAQGYDIRPTIAVTTARIQIPELVHALRQKLLTPDGVVLTESGESTVTKVAIEPVWWLPGVANRFQIDEGELRRCLFEQTGMFPELITRPDFEVFLPPIGGTTVYIFGDPSFIVDPTKEVTMRVHDECNGSDVFGSDICTCRPYLVHGIEECVLTAQRGGVGIIIYNRKEGRALGEVTKFLVYNARKRQKGGDRPEAYFQRTECVAGVQDMRFQNLMPDALHWLGVKKIDRFVSMSDMKYNAICSSGIEIKERVAIREEMIPKDAHVEMDAKRAAGYYNPTGLTKPPADQPPK